MCISHGTRGHRQVTRPFNKQSIRRGSLWWKITPNNHAWPIFVAKFFIIKPDKPLHNITVPFLNKISPLLSTLWHGLPGLKGVSSRKAHRREEIINKKKRQKNK